MILLLQLYYEFFKTGLFAIGGGLATLPFLAKMGVSTGWFTQAQLANMIAVSESTPGPIGINMATYVGYTTAGVLGGITATFGLITPSIIIILIIATLLKNFKDNPYVKGAFYGLRPASTGLIAASGLTVVYIALFNPSLYNTTGRLEDFINIPGIILAVGLLIFTRYVKPTKGLHPIIFIIFSAIIGIVFHFGGL